MASNGACSANPAVPTVVSGSARNALIMYGVQVTTTATTAGQITSTVEPRGTVVAADDPRWRSSIQRSTDCGRTPGVTFLMLHYSMERMAP